MLGLPQAHVETKGLHHPGHQLAGHQVHMLGTGLYTCRGGGGTAQWRGAGSA